MKITLALDRTQPGKHRMIATTIIIDHTYVEKLKELAAAFGMSFDALVRLILHHHVTHK